MATCLTDVSLSLKCSVCLELYTDPRVLPCLHTFCLHCLEPLVKNDRLTCPQCRDGHSIPKDGVSMYPVDLSLLPELGEAKEEKKICGSCTSGDVAVGYCTDCGEFLCEWCRDTCHKRNKAFISHTLVSLEDAPGFPSSTRDQHSYCDKHTDHKLEAYCSSCYAIACLVCTLENRRIFNHTHSYSLIKDAGNKLMTKIQESTKNLETKEKDLQIKFDCIEELEAVMRERQSEVESRITNACDEWIAALQERKEQLLSEVDDIFTKHSKKIWSAKNDIEILSLQLKKCRSFSLRYQKQGHLLSLTNQLIKNLEKSEAAKIKLDYLNELLLSHTLFNKSVLRNKLLGTLSSQETNKLNLEGKLVLKDSNDQLVNVERNKVNGSVDEILKIYYVLKEPFAAFFIWSSNYSANYNGYYDDDCGLFVDCSVVSKNEVLIECTPGDVDVFDVTLSASEEEVCRFSINIIGRKIIRSS